jgi:hypothetical protein
MRRTRRRRPGLNVTGFLYRAARLSNDMGTIASGKPHRIARRAKNKILGRILARLGFWRILWGK